MKAITPAEAMKQRIISIPDEMIDVVNDLIVSRINPNSQYQGIAILVDEIKQKFKEKYPSIELKNEWLYFEVVYRKAGWNVVYDSHYQFTFDPNSCPTGY